MRGFYGLRRHDAAFDEPTCRLASVRQTARNPSPLVKSADTSPRSSARHHRRAFAASGGGGSTTAVESYQSA
jgi:hypothetical protein